MNKQLIEATEAFIVNYATCVSCHSQVNLSAPSNLRPWVRILTVNIIDAFWVIIYETIFAIELWE